MERARAKVCSGSAALCLVCLQSGELEKQGASFALGGGVTGRAGPPWALLPAGGAAVTPRISRGSLGLGAPRAAGTGAGTVPCRTEAFVLSLPAGLLFLLGLVLNAVSGSRCSPRQRRTQFFSAATSRPGSPLAPLEAVEPLASGLFPSPLAEPGSAFPAARGPC